METFRGKGFRLTRSRADSAGPPPRPAAAAAAAAEMEDAHRAFAALALEQEAAGLKEALSLLGARGSPSEAAERGAVRRKERRLRTDRSWLAPFFNEAGRGGSVPASAPEPSPFALARGVLRGNMPKGVCQGGPWQAAEEADLAARVRSGAPRDAAGWEAVAAGLAGRSRRSGEECMLRWHNHLRFGGGGARKWTREESTQLWELAVASGGRDWEKVAAALGGRSAISCARLYFRKLDARYSRLLPFSSAEDAALLAAHRVVGGLGLAHVAAALPGRSVAACKRRALRILGREFGTGRDREGDGGKAGGDAERDTKDAEAHRKATGGGEGGPEGAAEKHATGAATDRSDRIANEEDEGGAEKATGRDTNAAERDTKAAEKDTKDAKPHRNVKHPEWTAAEDRRLALAAMAYGGDLPRAAAHLPGRSVLDAERRWRRHLDRSVVRGNWSDAEREELCGIASLSEEPAKLRAFARARGRAVEECADEWMRHAGARRVRRERFRARKRRRLAEAMRPTFVRGLGADELGALLLQR